MLNGLFLPPLPHWHCAIIGLDKSIIYILKWRNDEGTAEPGEKPKPQIS